MMTSKLAMLATVALLGLAGCGSDNAAPPGGSAGSAGSAGAGGGAGSANTISGTVAGETWSTAANGLWIDDATGQQTIFVFEKAMDCAGIQVAGWDKAAGLGQLLEITLGALDTKTYDLAYDPDAGRVASAAYLSALNPNVNPTATQGSVTVASFTSNDSISGSFDATFPAPQAGTLSGTFTAAYCPGGTEP
jgi:hypothetical protein